MKNEVMVDCIPQRHAALGIEIGSTRIKAVLIDETHSPIASGSFDWQNRFEDGFWTYSLDTVWAGLRTCLHRLSEELAERHGLTLSVVGAIGISAMMHGYLAFDSEGKLLTPFRTWRNTTSGPAAAALTEEFSFSIPQRWSVAHLYQAILNGESHVKEIAYLTTLAGYVHWRLTGEKVLGVGDASGMFPIDSERSNYREDLLNRFDGLIADRRYPWQIREILPRVLLAGETAGVLTAEGAALLAPTGELQPGIPLCPPEGDAGTGMTATNSVMESTGNVSAGTSVFLMAVLERPLKKNHTQIDLVTTPAGKPVAMVHCNNCTSDLDAWVNLLGEAATACGASIEKSQLYQTLYQRADQADADCGGLLSFNYLSGEPISDVVGGRPLLLRMPDARLTLSNFMRTLLYSALATLRIGMNILTDEEHVKLKRVLGHGGFFKTPQTAQRVMSAAINAPVAVMQTAGEGGAWGAALLAAFMRRKSAGTTLEAYLNENVFTAYETECVYPDEQDVACFERYLARYRAAIPVEQAAILYFQ